MYVSNHIVAYYFTGMYGEAKRTIIFLKYVSNITDISVIMSENESTMIGSILT